MTEPSKPARNLGRLGERVAELLQRGEVWFRARPRVAMVLLVAVVLLAGWRLLPGRRGLDDIFVATAESGTMVVRLTEAGTLKPAQSLTYRSPLAGQETEIIFLAPEGIRVNEGDLLVRLETSVLERNLARARQALRQAHVDLQMAEIDRQETADQQESLTEGQGALAVEEARSGLNLAEKKVKRLRAEYESLQPLMDRGFITREELELTAFELEQAEAEADLAQRKTKVYIERTYPRELRRSRHLLTQKAAQLENARAKLDVAKTQVSWLEESIRGCSIYARQPGLVIYEEYLQANPRRKIRVGDRVTRSQGLVTIPEVNRMLVEASVREADVHRVQQGQLVTIQLDAFPGLELSGKLVRVGTLARSSFQRPYEDKRFDLIVEVDSNSADLRPDMTARVDIIVGERQDVLLLPTNAVFERDGVYVCHVVHPFGFKTQQVELGETNSLHVEVLAGLEEGDQVALTDLSTGGFPEAAPDRRGPKAGRESLAMEGARLAPQ